MTKKLLHKTLKYYLSFLLLVLLFSIPLFYFVTQYLYVHEIEEGLLLQKKEFIQNSIPKLSEDDIKVWNRLNRNVKINESVKGLKKDTFYTKSYYDTLDAEMEPYRILVAPVTIKGKEHSFLARTNLVENKDLMIGISLLFAVIIFLLLVGLFILTKKLSTTLWKPFYQTLAQIEKFEIDKDSNLKLDSNSTEEFNRLNNAINKLVERNTLIYKSQREFVENAAHELQTPIAIFKGKLETLLQRSDLNAEQFELLDKLNEATTRLNRLNKNLLLLSKLESKYFEIDEEVLPKDIITNQSVFFKEQCLSRNIVINLELKPDIHLKSNQFLFEILISNLFLNSINHNIENGQINVVLKNNSLSFSNTGISKSLSTTKLFERFSKANPSSKGNGLGLSIIKKIVVINHWKIEYKFENNLHFFEIHF